MVKNNQYLSDKESKILGFLMEEEKERRTQLLEELKNLETLAFQRHQQYLRDNADLELTGLAVQTAEGEPGARERFAAAVREKLLAMTIQYGKFGFAVWDWGWHPDFYKDLTSDWKNVFKYEAKTVCDFHCTVLSENQHSENWAQEVFDSFFTIRDIKDTLGIHNNNTQEVDQVIHQVGRELIPVKYER